MRLETKQRCLACGYDTDAASAVKGDNEAKPEPGNISICLRCGHIMAYAEDMSFRELNHDEMLDVAGDKDILRFQELRARVMETKDKAKEADERLNEVKKPVEYIWAVLSVNNDGGEGIMASMDPETGESMPFVCSTEKNAAMMKMMAKVSRVGVKRRFVRFVRAEVIEEFEP